MPCDDDALTLTLVRAGPKLCPVTMMRVISCPLWRKEATHCGRGCVRGEYIFDDQWPPAGVRARARARARAGQGEGQHAGEGQAYVSIVACGLDS